MLHRPPTPNSTTYRLLGGVTSVAANMAMLWNNLQWVGDNDWLAAAIADGTCIAVTDGSYMKNLYPHIQLAAVVLECTRDRGRLWCSFSKAFKVACSYHGELIGLMAFHLILLAINEVNLGLRGSVHIYLDWLGALDKVKNLHPPTCPRACHTWTR